jgi:hypothetical protein
MLEKSSLNESLEKITPVDILNMDEPIGSTHPVRRREESGDILYETVERLDAVISPVVIKGTPLGEPVREMFRQEICDLGSSCSNVEGFTRLMRWCQIHYVPI